MVTIEQWIRREMATLVSGGRGQWGGDDQTGLGRPIYSFARNELAFAMTEFGFVYRNQASSISSRYDSIESLDLGSLQDLLTIRGDIEKTMNMTAILRGDPRHHVIGLPAWLYSAASTTLLRIVRELA